MKKLILTFALVAVSQVGVAQAKKATPKKVATTEVTTAKVVEMTDEEYKKGILKVIEKGSVGSQLKMVKEQVIKQIPSDKQAAFLVEFDASLEDLQSKLIPVYMETYTKEDVKAMIAFYESPVGKKMAEQESSLNEKSQEVAKTWGEGFQAMMMKYMQ
jgi:hypothetical protein